MKKKEWNDSLNHLDPDLVEKYVEQKDGLRQKNKKPKGVWLRFGVIAACFVLVVSVLWGVPMLREDDPATTGQNDNNQTFDTDTLKTGDGNQDIIDSTNSSADDLVTGDVGSAQPSIFPSAWKKMNAVIVKWGEQNGQTWVENYGKYSHYNEENYSIEYVGVNVEFVTIFSETMSESLINDIEKVIEQTTYLMIPKLYLEEIEVGDTSLVFLQKIAHIADTDAAGKFLGTYTTVLGAMVGDCLAEDKYVPAPIFNIENNKICVPEQAYETRPENGEYYSYIMGLLQEANEYVLKKDSSSSVAFEDGASVEDISELFAIVCNGKSR